LHAWQGPQPVPAARGRGSRGRDRPRSHGARGGQRGRPRRREGVRHGQAGPAGADRPRGLRLAPDADPGQAGRADPARARARAALAARRVALQDGAPRLVRRRLEGRADPRLAATALERAGADRDVRLVPREPRQGRGGRGHAPRAVEPAGARPAEEDLVIVLTRADVEALLDLDELVDAVGGALADLSAGRASMPPRIAALVPEVQGLLGTMPAYLPGASLAVKLVTLFPQNRDRHTHQA